MQIHLTWFEKTFLKLLYSLCYPESIIEFLLIHSETIVDVISQKPRL